MRSDATTDSPVDPVERTVQLAGNSTFVVSLPKAWAVEQGLESGSSMYLYPHDDRRSRTTTPLEIDRLPVRTDAPKSPTMIQNHNTNWFAVPLPAEEETNR